MQETKQYRYVRIQIPLPSLVGNYISFVGMSLVPDIAICLPAACNNRKDTLHLLNHIISKVQPYVPVFLPDIVNTSTFKVITEQTDSFGNIGYVSIAIFTLFVLLVTVATTTHLTGIVLVRTKAFLHKIRNIRKDERIMTPPEHPTRPLIESELNIQTSEHDEITAVINTDKSPQLSKPLVTSLKLFQCFSLHTNIKLFISPHSHSLHSIKCLSSLRVLSMLWALLCHSYLWLLMTGAVDDFDNLLINNLPLLSFTITWNGYAALESLFVISGCLAMFLSFKQLEGNVRYLPFLFKYYLYHILRITPTYFLLILLIWGLTPHLGSGPMWSPAAGKMSGSCEEYWWTNFLYINTFYPSRLVDSCVSWSWFIALEMQFMLLSPIFIISSHVLRAPFSLILPISVFLLSTCSNLFVFFFNDINTHMAYLQRICLNVSWPCNGGSISKSVLH